MSNAVRKRFFHQPGFTLIEIIVVILIIGIIASIFLPRFTGLSRGNLKTVTRHLIGTIRTLSDEAESRQKILRLDLNLADQLYDISILNNDGEFVSFHTDTLRKVQFPEQIRLKDVMTLRQGKVTEGTAYVHFFPIGRVEKALLHFEEGGRPLTLKIFPLSGKVKLYDGYIEED